MLISEQKAVNFELVRNNYKLEVRIMVEDNTFELRSEARFTFLHGYRTDDPLGNCRSWNYYAFFVSCIR
jgi:hypothetical protein